MAPRADAPAWRRACTSAWGSTGALVPALADPPDALDQHAPDPRVRVRRCTAHARRAGGRGSCGGSRPAENIAGLPGPRAATGSGVPPSAPAWVRVGAARPRRGTPARPRTCGRPRRSARRRPGPGAASSAMTHSPMRRLETSRSPWAIRRRLRWLTAASTSSALTGRFSRARASPQRKLLLQERLDRVPSDFTTRGRLSSTVS